MSIWIILWIILSFCLCVGFWVGLGYLIRKWTE